MAFAVSAIAQTAAENTAAAFYQLRLTSLVNNKTIAAKERDADRRSPESARGIFNRKLTQMSQIKSGR
jgi:hypothetical protein